MTIELGKASQEQSSDSPVFKQLQLTYLIGYALAAAGNNLQGSYRYALLASYNIPRSTIESLYLCAHLSTLCLGTITSSLSDKFGRRLACILSSVFYTIHCLSLNFNILSVLVLGSIFRGMAHSLYNTNFESWLLQEHHDNDLDTDSLKHLLRNAFLSSTLAAVAAGIVAEISAEFLGYAAPFEVAVGIYLVMIFFLIWQWKENYGDREAKVSTSFVAAIEVIRTDTRVLLVGLITSLFEATIYIYSLEWTPALEDAKLWTISDSLPLGFMFSSFMAFNMMGAFLFKALARRFDIHTYLPMVMLVAAVALSIPVIIPNAQILVFIGLCMYELCVGIYLPSISLLRNRYLPDSVRSTLMNYFRIPRFAFMFAIIIWHLRLSIIFMCCIVMLVLSGIFVIILRGIKDHEDRARQNERTVLLSGIPPMNVQLKRVQMRGELTNEMNNN
ncbi:unnamed protein product [Adineta ricciae]|uniref:Major facilitator superfamily (MFS) profile domain-containing protein n=1 Tax=Adineta ricciae TaxID=249248 RepID=A0A814H1Z4_ADIRI|nr:unnamed protein product [Adineta ricciae]